MKIRATIAAHFLAISFICINCDSEPDNGKSEAGDSGSDELEVSSCAIESLGLFDVDIDQSCACSPGKTCLNGTCYNTLGFDNLAYREDPWQGLMRGLSTDNPEGQRFILENDCLIRYVKTQLWSNRIGGRLYVELWHYGADSQISTFCSTAFPVSSLPYYNGNFSELGAIGFSFGDGLKVQKGDLIDIIFYPVYTNPDLSGAGTVSGVSMDDPIENAHMVGYDHTDDQYHPKVSAVNKSWDFLMTLYYDFPPKRSKN